MQNLYEIQTIVGKVLSFERVSQIYEIVYWFSIQFLYNGIFIFVFPDVFLTIQHN